MLRFVVVSMLAIFYAGSVFGEEGGDLQMGKPLSNAEKVLAIYASDWGLKSSGKPSLISCVWGDGLVVWSNDGVNGGPPYKKARLETGKADSLFARVARIGAFEVQGTARPYVGPDTMFTTILLRANGKQLKLESWHERFEASGNVVALERGLTGLADQKLLSALSKESPDYLLYRMVWLELRLAVASVLPLCGKETKGMVSVNQGQLSWRRSDGRRKGFSEEKVPGEDQVPGLKNYEETVPGLKNGFEGAEEASPRSDPGSGIQSTSDE